MYSHYGSVIIYGQLAPSRRCINVSWFSFFFVYIVSTRVCMFVSLFCIVFPLCYALISNCLRYRNRSALKRPRTWPCKCKFCERTISFFPFAIPSPTHNTLFDPTRSNHTHVTVLLLSPPTNVVPCDSDGVQQIIISEYVSGLISRIFTCYLKARMIFFYDLFEP